jgi:hypothetical protein
MKIRNVLLGLGGTLLLLLLSGCSTFAGMEQMMKMFDRPPESESSSLIYGYLNIDTNQSVSMHFLQWETAVSIPSEEETKSLTREEKKQYEAIMMEMPGIVLDTKSGAFAVQVNQPETYCLYEILFSSSSTTGAGNMRTTTTYNHSFIFDAPEKEDALTVGAGEMVYWGACDFVLDENTGEGKLEASATVSRAEVLDILEEKLRDKGWDEWISAEKGKL